MTSAFAPSNAAAGTFLKGFWQMEGRPSYQAEWILPKGEIELIFSFSDSLDFNRQGQLAGQTPRCFVNGISNMPVCLTAPRQQSFFGVVLRPAAVKQLLGVPSGAFLNAITDLELVDPSWAAAWHELAACPSFEEEVAFLQSWVLRKRGVLHAQERALSTFLADPVAVDSVAGLASHLCYSTRQLHRKVQEVFGMSSEVLLRFKRYRQALDLMHHSRETLTRIAYSCGYYDQSHFNREFKEYTGLTPGAYRQQRSHLPGHLYQ